jgi:hypothetical protein
MSCSPPGGDDAARAVTAQSRDDEQDIASRHTDDPYPFFSVLKTSVDLFEPVRVLNRCDGVHEVDAVPASILGSLRGIPLVIHPRQDYWLPVALSRTGHTASTRRIKCLAPLSSDAQRGDPAGIEDAELEEARAYLLGREPFRRETARQWANLLTEAEHYGLPLADPEERKAELNALDKPAVEAAARRHVSPERLRVTVGLPR